MTHRAAVALVVLLGSAVLAQTGKSPGDSPSPTRTPQPPTVDKAASGLGANLPFASDVRKAVDRLKGAGKEPPACEPKADSEKAATPK